MKQTKLEDELKVITVDVLNVKSKCEKTITDMETMKSLIGTGSIPICM